MRFVGTIEKVVAPSHIGLNSWNSEVLVYERNTQSVDDVVDFFKILF